MQVRRLTVFSLAIMASILVACSAPPPEEPGFTLIGPEGGSVRSSDGLLELVISSGALDAIHAFRVRPTSKSVPDRYGNQIIKVYSVEPVDVIFKDRVIAGFNDPNIAMDREQVRYVHYARNAWQGAYYATSIDRDLPHMHIVELWQGGLLSAVIPNESSTPLVAWPLPRSSRITQAHGQHQGNWDGHGDDNFRYKHHMGLDISNGITDQSQVVAFADGTVLPLCRHPEQACPFGNTVVIQHDQFGDEPIFSLYAHLTDFSTGIGVLEAGQRVLAGQQIGREGSTKTVSEHLHFELRTFTDYCYLGEQSIKIPGTEVYELSCGYSAHPPAMPGYDHLEYLDPLEYIYPLTSTGMAMARPLFSESEVELHLRTAPGPVATEMSELGYLQTTPLTAWDIFVAAGRYLTPDDPTCSSWLKVSPYQMESTPLLKVRIPPDGKIETSPTGGSWGWAEYFHVNTTSAGSRPIRLAPSSSISSAWVCEAGPILDGQKVVTYMTDAMKCEVGEKRGFTAASACPAPGPSRPLSGTFYQFSTPDTADYLGAKGSSHLAAWRGELDDLIAIGMDTVIIQFATFRDRATGTTTVWHDDSLFSDLLIAANERRMHVFLGLGYDDAWGVDYDPTEEVLPLNPTAQQQTALVDTIYADLQTRLAAAGQPGALSALAGFYIPQEISNSPTIIGYDTVEPYAQPMFPMVDYLRTITDHVHATTGLKVMVAPYFGVVSTPERYAQWWDATLTEADIDILALQDGVGTERFCDITEALPYFTALGPVARAHGVDFWSDLETFRVIDLDPWRDVPSDFDRVHRQFALTEPHVSKIVIFAFRDDMSPQEGGAAAALYSAYRDYLSVPASMPTSLERCRVTRIEVGSPELTVRLGEYASPYKSTGVVHYTYDVIGGSEASRSLTYASSNPSVASVDAFGSIVAHQPGTTTITLRSYTAPSVTTTMRVVVPQPRIESVEIIGVSHPFGGRITCDVAFTECTMHESSPGDGLYFGLLTRVTRDTGQEIWGTHFSSSNPGVAACSTDVNDPDEADYCTIIAVGNGSTIITVYSDHDPSVYDAIRVNVVGR